VHLDLPAQVNDRVGIGRFEDVAVLGDDHRIPVDQLLGRAILLAVVAEQDLHQLNAAVVDRGRRVEDDVAQTRGVRILACALRERVESWGDFRRADLHELSAVDATSFAIMKRARIRLAYAFDHHFAVVGFRMVG